MHLRKKIKHFFVGAILLFVVGYHYPTDNWSLPTDPNANNIACDIYRAPTEEDKLLCSIDSSVPVADSSETTVRRADESLQLALARICVSESGFQIRTWDCRLIYEVLRHRSSTGELTMGIMRNYATATFNRRRTDARRWIPFLEARGGMPRHWSEATHLSWSVYRSRFLEVYQYAGYLLTHNPEYPCSLPVHHWGARNFRVQTLVRRGWIRVECDADGRHTLNQFWLVPHSVPTVERVCSEADRLCTLD